MDDLTSLYYFFANSPKRQQYFETFIDYQKDEISNMLLGWQKPVGLRHKAIENHYILYWFVVSTFESICNPTLYQKFYVKLEKKRKEKWSWDKKAVSKVQGLFAPCQRFDRLVAFAVWYNGSEPQKPLLTKIQKRNQDIYQVYQMINQVINDLRETKDNMDEELHHWYEMACEMAKSVSAMLPSEQRLAKCWSWYRKNVPSEDCESYRSAIEVPVMDALIVSLHDPMADRKHIELLTLLPSVCLSSKLDLNATATSLQNDFGDDL